MIGNSQGKDKALKTIRVSMFLVDWQTELKVSLMGSKTALQGCSPNQCKEPKKVDFLVFFLALPKE